MSSQPAPAPSGHPQSGVRTALNWLTRSNRSVREGEDRVRSAALGGTPCSQLGDRHQVQIAGSLTSVSLRPRAGVPALEAELSDGTGSVTLIFLGRREIPGITPGRWVRVRGLASVDDGSATIYNPQYELIPAPRV